MLAAATAWNDFDLMVGSLLVSEGGTDETWPVVVFRSPDGPASGTLHLPVRSASWQQQLAAVSGLEADLTARKEVGERLFNALFTGTVRDRWMASVGRSQALRLRLWINNHLLAALPWELLRAEDDFLAARANMAVVRYLPVVEPPAGEPEESVRVLLVLSSPQGVPPVGEAELAPVLQALQTQPQAVYHVLRNPTLPALAAALQAHKPHVLHYVGHGAPGLLFLSDEAGYRAEVEAEAFAQLFQGRHTPLVLLNACASAVQDSLRGLFSGVAQALSAARVPAVVAMQYPFVLMETAARFNTAFYSCLFAGLSVDMAVNEARQLLAAQDLATRDWSTPVLYLATQFPILLASAQPDTKTDWQQLRQRVTASPMGAQVWNRLEQQLRELAARQHSLQQHQQSASHWQALAEALEPAAKAVAQASYGPLPAPVRETIRGHWQRVCQRDLPLFHAAGATADQQALLSLAAALDEDLRQYNDGFLRRHVQEAYQLATRAAARQQSELASSIEQLALYTERLLGALD